MSQARKDKVEWDDARRGRLSRAYAAGISLKDLASRFGTSEGRVLQELRRAGVPLRQPRKRRKT